MYLFIYLFISVSCCCCLVGRLWNGVYWRPHSTEYLHWKQTNEKLSGLTALSEGRSARQTRRQTETRPIIQTFNAGKVILTSSVHVKPSRIKEEEFLSNTFYWREEETATTEDPSGCRGRSDDTPPVSCWPATCRSWPLPWLEGWCWVSECEVV